MHATRHLAQAFFDTHPDEAARLLEPLDGGGVVRVARLPHVSIDEGPRDSAAVHLEGPQVQAMRRVDAQRADSDASVGAEDRVAVPGEGLQGGERLGTDDEQGARRIQFVQGPDQIRPVDVGDEVQHRSVEMGP